MLTLVLASLVGQAIVPPTLVGSAEPVYPVSAIEARVYGRVRLSIDIDQTGHVTRADIEDVALTSEDGVARDDTFGFAEAALAAAPALTFTPATADGVAILVRVTYTFVFAPPPLPEPEEVVLEPEPVIAAPESPPLEETSADYDVTVETTRPALEVVRRTVDRKAVEKMPGGLGDPIRVIENLPGVARTPTGSGDIIVRGSGPQDSGVFIDGMSVPIVFHFGGLRSVIPPQLVDSVDFYPGNFSAEYGRFTGGIVDVKLRAPELDAIHGSIDVSLLDASVFAAIPITKKLSIAIGGRRSYIDAILSAALSGSEDVNLQSAPVYYDGQIVTTYRFNDKHDMTLSLLGSSDDLELLLSNPASIDLQLTNGRASNTTSFVRAQLRDRLTISDTMTNEVQLAAGRDRSHFAFGGLFDIDTTQRSLLLRDRFIWRPSSRISLELGADVQWSSSDADVLATRPPQEGGGSFEPVLTTRETHVRDVQAFNPALYTQMTWTVHEHLQLIPALRIDHFSRLDATTADPRLLVRVPIVPALTLKGGAGLTHQSPTLQELDPVFGNPDMGPINAWQYSAGAEINITETTRLDAVGFYKDVRRIVSSSGRVVERDGETVPEVYTNGGRGRVYGAEFFLEQKVTHGVRGWLSYTLSRAERRDFGSDRTRLFDFDQTHILSAVLLWTLPRDWEVGVRWRFVSGNPTTPVVGGVFLSDLDEYGPIDGRTNSERLPSFHQLDVRFDKTWRYDGWTLGAYLNLTNAYNRRNPEGVNYAFDYSARSYSSGLPIYPILGLKAEL